MKRDHLLGYPPAAHHLGTDYVPEQRTPVRPKLSAEEQRDRRKLDVPPSKPAAKQVNLHTTGEFRPIPDGESATAQLHSMGVQVGEVILVRGPDGAPSSVRTYTIVQSATSAILKAMNHTTRLYRTRAPWEKGSSWAYAAV